MQSKSAWLRLKSQLQKVAKHYYLVRLINDRILHGIDNKY